jgi:hypothetical protein
VQINYYTESRRKEITSEKGNEGRLIGLEAYCIETALQNTSLKERHREGMK